MPTHRRVQDPLCVITFPSSLAFYVDDSATYKQKLTIFNPYGFQVKYQVKCADNSKYAVSQAEGEIPSLSALELMVRHKAVFSANIGISDIIRVELRSKEEYRLHGSKDIVASLLMSKLDPPAAEVLATAAATATIPDPERFKPLASEAVLTQYLSPRPVQRRDQRDNPTYILVCTMAAIVCFIILALPNEGEESNFFPYYLHLSHTIKLIAAFVLGTF